MDKWLASLFTLSFATTPLLAETYLSADSCPPCAQLLPSRGPDWIITPNAGPCVECGVDLFITGEFLYWTVREDHLAFASRNPANTQNLTEPDVRKGWIAHPDWNFSPGFRAGIGFITDHDGWDLYANYTWLRPRGTKESLAPSDNFLVVDTLNWVGLTPALGSTTDQIISLARGKWELDFNVIDFELGRNFFISRYLKLRPHFGLKGTWQKQRMGTKFKYTDSALPGDLIAKGSDQLDYWGIGICGGLDTAWQFNNCFSLIGELAATALWERFETERSVLITQTLSNGSILYHVPVALDSNFHTIKPVLEFFLGLRYEDWFCCDTYHISLEAGWEEQWWADQNQFFQFAVETRLGDLIMQGLTVKVRFDF